MKNRTWKYLALAVGGGVIGLFPGCVEVFLLNIATPFLLGQ